MEERQAQSSRPDGHLFYDAFKASPIGIAVEDLEGRPLFVNPALCSMLGFSEEEMRNKHCVEFSPPEDAEKDWALFEQLRAGSIDHYHLEKRFFRRDGSLLWGRLSISLLKNGASPLVVAMVEDITEKWMAKETLVWRLELERLLSNLSRTFISLPEQEIDTNMELGLARIGEFLEIDRITLFEFSRDRTGLIPTYAWNAPGVMKAPSSIETKSLPWWRDKVLGCNVSLMSRLDDLPEEASAEKQYFRDRGILSAASVPLKVGGEVTGTITFVSIRRRVSWTKDLVNQLSVIGDIFCNALKRKRATEALLVAQVVVSESEERFRLVANTAPVMIWMSDIDGLCTYGNQPWLDFNGQPFEGELGKSWALTVHPEDLVRSLHTYTRAFGLREPFQIEHRLRRHDGQYRWILASGVPRFNLDGSFAGYIASGIDVTERKLAEEAQRESEERFRLAAQAGRMYAFDWNVLSDVIIRSEESTHIFGLTGEPMRLTHPELLARVHPEDRATFMNSLAECTPESPNTQISYRLLRPDGSVRWLERTGHAYFDHQGRMVRMIGMVADITERKLAEDKLQEYERAVEGLEEMITVVDREYRYLIANNKYLKMRNMTKEQVVGHLAPEVLNKGVFEAIVKEKLDECFQGKVVRYEMKYTYPELGERDVFISYFPMEGANGVDRVACIAQDITERKRAEEALAESEERLRLAQQAARIGTFEWNIRTGVNTWTPELEAMYGLSPGSFGGTQTAFETLVHPDDRAEVIESVGAAMKTGQPTNGEWRVVWSDGSVHWIAGRWQVFMNESGEPSRMIGVNIEVTERKVAEQALHESEQRFRLAAQTGKMYSFEWDVTTDVVVRSPEHVKVLGATEPLPFSHQQFVHSIHADDRPKFIATIAGLTPENPTAEAIYRVCGSDGALVWLKSSGRAFFDPEGKMLRVIGMVADITDLKRAEEALSEMTQKLIEAQEQERSRLARELHDDINQKLALLAVNLESLKQGVPASVVELGQRIAETSKQVGDIGKDIQALSHRLHSPKLEYLGLATAAASFCKEFSDQQKVEIAFHSESVPKELPQGISLCLFRVLQEALQNASKHSGSRQLEVSLNGRANEIELTVHDSGVGFDPEEAIKGRGLGLTSMKERLKLVDGRLSIDSKPQLGTTIHARVPLHPRTKSAGAVG